MKVLLVSSSSGSRGGGELFLLYLGEALTRRGHAVTLWASSHSRMDELAQKFARFGSVARGEYANTYDRPGRSLATFFDRVTPRRAAAQWRQLAPDCIHVNKQNLEDGLDLLRAAQLTDLPAVSTIHLTQSAKYLRAKSAAIRDFVARRILRQIKIPYVAVLENRRRDLAHFLRDGANAHMIANGVPLPDLSALEALRTTKRAELGLDPGSLLVVGVGRMMPQKRPLLWLKTADEIQTKVAGARLIWLGDGPLAPEWDAWIAARGVTQNQISREPWTQNVLPFLAAADAFLHTAEYEGLPLAMLEAMAAGLPCVITENLRRDMPFLNDTNSIVIGESGEWLASLRDRAALAATGERARALIERDFSCDAMAARYEALYEKTRAS